MNFDITTFAQSVVATILGSGIAVGLLERYWRWRDKKEDRQIQTARKTRQAVRAFVLLHFAEPGVFSTVRNDQQVPKLGRGQHNGRPGKSRMSPRF